MTFDMQLTDLHWMHKSELSGKHFTTLAVFFISS